MRSKTYSVILAAVVRASSEAEAERIMLDLAPFDTLDDHELLRGTVHDDNGEAAIRLAQSQ